MKRPRPAVIWIGRVSRLELCVPCPTCHVEIGAECDTTVFRQMPHAERTVRAETFGFRSALGELGESAHAR